MKRNSKSEPLNRASVRKTIRELFARSRTSEIVVQSFYDVLKGYAGKQAVFEDGAALFTLATLSESLAREAELGLLKRCSPDNLVRFAFRVQDNSPADMVLVFAGADGQLYPVKVMGNEYDFSSVPLKELARIAGISYENTDTQKLRRLGREAFSRRLPFILGVWHLARSYANAHDHPGPLRTQDQAIRNARSQQARCA